MSSNESNGNRFLPPRLHNLKLPIPFFFAFACTPRCVRLHRHLRLSSIRRQTSHCSSSTRQHVAQGRIRTKGSTCVESKVEDRGRGGEGRDGSRGRQGVSGMTKARFSALFLGDTHTSSRACNVITCESDRFDVPEGQRTCRSREERW